MSKRAATGTALIVAVLVASAGHAGSPAIAARTTRATASVGTTLPLTVEIGQWWQDAFPANENDAVVGTPAFDTTSAWVKTGNNDAPGVASATRPIVPGDTTLVLTDPAGPPMRVDLVFRILPGPGNYPVASSRTFPLMPSMQVLQLPTNQSTIATAGDSSFWGQYMADPGAFGTPAGHYGGTRWDPLTWNSARCDTAERNVFPTTRISANVGGAPGLGNQWASMYHEEDPKFAVLGKVKFRCFHVETTFAANQFNIRCDGTVPTWLNVVPASRTGWDGTNRTREYSKIISDGLLTPGSHVQYFYRRSDVATPAIADLLPDTSKILQTNEGSTDLHRWQSLSILPDRWKSTAFGGHGMACMLVLDMADRRGQETAWFAAADSSGMNASRHGVQTGWFARGDANPADPGQVEALSVHRNEQPGAVYDLYNVKQAESPLSATGLIGSRLGNRPVGQLIQGKEARTAPTPRMLRTYYRMVVMLTGDAPRELGPTSTNTSNDTSVLTDFLTNATPSPAARGLWVIGSGFAAVQNGSAFLTQTLGMTSAGASYRTASGYAGDFCTMDKLAPDDFLRWSTPGDGEVLASSASLPEVRTALTWGPLGLPSLAGAHGPAAMEKPAETSRNYIARLDGFDLRELRGLFSGNTAARSWFLTDVLSRTFSAQACLFGEPVLGAPPAAPAHDALALLGNPMRGSGTTLRLTLATRGRATVRLLDVSGRVVRTLVDGTLEPGTHDLRWDGTDERGAPVRMGVYLARMTREGPGADVAKKVIVIR